MDTYISEIHKEAIEEYIDNLLKEKHLNMPNVDSYAEHRIKQLAKDIFLAGYKDALETEELEKNKNIYNIDKLELNLNTVETVGEAIIEKFNSELKKFGTIR